MANTLIKLADFTPEELRAWQKRLLEILVYFSEFCQKHQLKFYLAYGTLLGAIRHKGFIPWDDDVDVQMPREDFEKLYELWEKDTKNLLFTCCKTKKGNCIYFPEIIIRHNNTTCIYEHSIMSDGHHGLKLDVGFLDGVPENKILRFRQFIHTRLYGLFTAQRIPNAGSPIVKAIASILLNVIKSPKLRDIIWMYSEKRIKQYQYSECKYIRYLGTKVMLREWFDETLYVEFEGHQMPIPKGYHEILTNEYGDYMSLPPIEQRKPITQVVFYDLNHSYTEYKGVHYCKQYNV